MTGMCNRRMCADVRAVNYHVCCLQPMLADVPSALETAVYSSSTLLQL
jgi:hypothetical protein